MYRDLPDIWPEGAEAPDDPNEGTGQVIFHCSCSWHPAFCPSGLALTCHLESQSVPVRQHLGGGGVGHVIVWEPLQPHRAHLIILILWASVTGRSTLPGQPQNLLEAITQH